MCASLINMIIKTAVNRQKVCHVIMSVISSVLSEISHSTAGTCRLTFFSPSKVGSKERILVTRNLIKN